MNHRNILSSYDTTQIVHVPGKANVYRCYLGIKGFRNLNIFFNIFKKRKNIFNSL